MNVLLVTSPHLNHSSFLIGGSDETNNQYAQRFAPMGLISLAGAAGSDARIQIADINKAINRAVLPLSSDFYDETAQWLLSYDVDLIGFMTEVDSYHHLLRICQKIKSRKRKTLTLLGGVHASAIHRETLEAFADIDFVIRGEGEIAFPTLLKALKTAGKLDRVNNLSYRVNNQIVSTASVPLIDDLDSLPFPDFSYFDLTLEDIIYLEVGRGCPFKCNFCFTASYWQRKHRIKSAERILRELNYFKSNYQRTDFNFTHDLFTTDRKWVIDFCQKLAASDLNVTWTCSSRTDTIDEEQIHWMKRAGCREIYFGVETGTPEMQEKIQKDLDLAEADRIIEATTKAGIGATIGFIAGLPGETASSLRTTLNKALHFLSEPANTVHVFGFYANAGSPNFENVKSNLVFDEHFVDFPLPEQIHIENCELIKNNFPVFTRYSRLNSYNDIEVDTIQAADEFFPMINPLRQLMLAIQAKGVDLFDVLSAWSKWIESHNREIRRRYQGTLQMYLEFLEDYLNTNSVLDEVIAEMIRWETHKNTLRCLAKAVTPMPTKVPGIRFTNPSLIIDSFSHTDKFLQDTTISKGCFGFYKRLDGSSDIVRLNELAVVVLNCAHDGVAIEELHNELNLQARNAGVLDEQAITQLLENLQRLDLLVPAAQSPHYLTSQLAGGIKGGYIPILN